METDAARAVTQAIRRRRSVGRSEGELSKTLIEELIETATWAPNHHLTEPWTFTVLLGDARRKLGEFWANMRADELGMSGEKRDGFVQGELQKPLRAPVLVIVSVRTDSSPVTAAEDFAATAAAVQNLLLAATSRGYSAMWRTGDLAYHAAVKRYLELAPNDRIVAVVYLGERGTKPPQDQNRKTPSIRWRD